MADFRCFVTTQTGLPIADSAVRVLSALGADVTAFLFGRSPVYTGADGVFSMPSAAFGSITGVVPAGTYTIIATAPGYSSSSVDSTSSFTGVGSFVIALPVDTNPSPAGSVEGPGSDYVSPACPVELLVSAQAQAAKWEYIEATITNSSGIQSVLEVLVSAGSARLNVQARLELETGLYLVGDDQIAAIDPDFSDDFTITLASLTPSGRVDLEADLLLHVANAMPDGELNDLINFTNLNPTGLADWLTPWQEVPKFAGHYADAMVWLPAPGLNGYVLQTTFQNINRTLIQTITTNLDNALFATGNVVRIRIPEPIEGARYGVLTILHANQPQTHSLIVRFIHG